MSSNNEMEADRYVRAFGLYMHALFGYHEISLLVAAYKHGNRGHPARGEISPLLRLAYSLVIFKLVQKKKDQGL